MYKAKIYKILIILTLIVIDIYFVQTFSIKSICVLQYSHQYQERQKYTGKNH